MRGMRGRCDGDQDRCDEMRREAITAVRLRQPIRLMVVGMALSFAWLIPPVGKLAALHKL